MNFQSCLVVPCFNEAKRLPVEAYAAYLDETDDVYLVFVDDGSTDSTGELLRSLADRFAARVGVVRLCDNVGKGNAVHAGMAHALSCVEASYYGFWDSDLSIPLDLLDDFVRVFREKPAVAIVTGCRHKRLGVDIQRSPARHYVGRIFATFVSVCLNLSVYDTQCGAKLFQKDIATRVFSSPFLSRWVFDVEIYYRLLQDTTLRVDNIVYELPLRCWINKDGSKVNAMSYLLSAVDILKMHCYYKLLNKK